MKTKIILSIVVGAGLPAWASLFTSSPGAVIPDNNPSGYANTISVSGLGSQLTGVIVQLNISGGYNGDLLAYLTYGGQTVTLLNRVGTGGGNTYGYADTGFAITLNDSGSTGLHNYQANSPTYNGSGQLTGTWQPDSGGTTFSSAYGGVDPNGTWQIFFADMSAGDQSTLVSWSLDITAVPEPVNVAMAIFGVGFVGAGAVRRYRGSSQAKLPPARLIV